MGRKYVQEKWRKHMSQDVTERTIGGIHVVLYPDGPYIPVAERVRLIHTLGKAFGIEQVETLSVQGHWIYRAHIRLDDHHFIGDAEVQFGAPLDSPHGTNPLSCAQTAAIGNALTFAGFGDARLLLDLLGQNSEEARMLYPQDPPHDLIEGVRVIWLDQTPYVSVAERLYHLYRLGGTCSIERCEISKAGGVWLYRVWAMVNGSRYVGDAEIHFDVPVTSPEGRYPISSAQTPAVGTVLAMAGFGDVRSLLERSGKGANALGVAPALASADAVLAARRMLEARERQGFYGSTGTPQEATPASRPSSRQPQDHFKMMTPSQREQIHVLCERLGETEPEYEHMTSEAAESLIARLRAIEEDLLLEAFQAREQKGQRDGAASPGSPSPAPVSQGEIGALKRAWLAAFQVEGTRVQMQEQWHRFKMQVCGGVVNDTAMTREQYDQLCAATRQRTDDQANAPANGAEEARKHRS
jgi:hypothetical protein